MVIAPPAISHSAAATAGLGAGPVRRSRCAGRVEIATLALGCTLRDAPESARQKLPVRPGSQAGHRVPVLQPSGSRPNVRWSRRAPREHAGGARDHYCDRSTVSPRRMARPQLNAGR